MLKKSIKPLLVFVLTFLFWSLIKNFEFLADYWYNLFVVNYNQFVGSLINKIDLPIGEILYLGVIIGLIFLIIFFFKLNDGLKRFHLIIYTFTHLFSIYQSCWGIVYHVNKFEGIDTNSNIYVDDLKAMYFNYLNESISIRKQIDNNGEFVIEFNNSKGLIINEFNQVESILKKHQWIKNYQIIDKPNYKVSNFPNLMMNCGVLGYYNPFTVESNVNSINTDLKNIQTIFHELAHQMGFASENEANFIAFLIAYNSKNPEIKYSALYKVIFSLLGNIAKYDEHFVEIEMLKMPYLIRKDYENENNYYKQFDSQLNDVFSQFNNQFLKLNNQDGVISYSKYIILINHYNRLKKINN